MTRRVGLLGKPLQRRHSQVMHDAAFDAAGIDARYVLLEVEPDAVEPAVRAARESDVWLGLGVTAPYKRVVAGLVDAIEADAERIGAVNNVVREASGRLVGINTDAPGFRAGAELAMGSSLSGATVVVVGAGGAAHAVVYACLDAGARWVTIANRTDSTARALADHFRDMGQGAVVAIPSSGLVFEAALAGADLAVNATTVGMLDAGMTIPVDRLPATATVFDLVYVPAETPLLHAARARGLRAANGSEMLIAQAAIAFERWTGVGGMADVMRTAVAPLLADPTVRA
jgi:shikimate dehydrogenase